MLTKCPTARLAGRREATESPGKPWHSVVGTVCAGNLFRETRGPGGQPAGEEPVDENPDASAILNMRLSLNSEFVLALWDPGATVRCMTHDIIATARRISRSPAMSREGFWREDAEAVAFSAALGVLEKTPDDVGLAHTVARNKTLDFIRTITHDPRRLRSEVAAGTATRAQLGAALDARRPSGMEDAVTVAVAGPGPDDLAETKTDCAWVLENLPLRMSGVLRMYFLEDKTMREVSEIEGVSIQRADQLVKKALELARGMLQSER